MDNNIIIKNRETLNITGVEHIYSFNDTKIELRTNKGDITILGEKLDLDKISIEEGIINIQGLLISLAYAKNSRKNDDGFFKKFFK